MGTIRLGVVTSDWHIGEKAPAFRSVEKDWYKAMERPFVQIDRMLNKMNNPILLVAGDLFDIADCRAEVINWATANIPPAGMFAIPGQHDMPNHNREEMHRSAYLTLQQSLPFRDLSPREQIIPVSGRYTLRLIGFPFGEPVRPVDRGMNKNKKTFCIALAHKFVWSETDNLASEMLRTRNNRIANVTRKQWSSHNLGLPIYDNRLGGYDAIIFGDNHRGFIKRIGLTTVFNCGSLMRRHIDQKDYFPQVGILTVSDDKLSIESVSIDTSEDQCTEVVENQNDHPEEENVPDFKDFNELGHYLIALHHDITSFEARLRKVFTNGVPSEVIALITKGLEKCQAQEGEKPLLTSKQLSNRLAIIVRSSAL